MITDPWKWLSNTLKNERLLTGTYFRWALIIMFFQTKILEYLCFRALSWKLGMSQVDTPTSHIQMADFHILLQRSDEKKKQLILLGSRRAGSCCGLFICWIVRYKKEVHEDFVVCLKFKETSAEVQIVKWIKTGGLVAFIILCSLFSSFDGLWFTLAQGHYLTGSLFPVDPRTHSYSL